MASQCCGRGECLRQESGESDHEENEIDHGHVLDMTCPYKCKPLACPNVALCGEYGPLWYFDCHRGTCVNCAVCGPQKNVQLLSYEWECPVCMETCEHAVILDRCDHMVCVRCWRHMNGWRDREESEPSDEEENAAYHLKLDRRRRLLSRCPLCRA